MKPVTHVQEKAFTRSYRKDMYFDQSEGLICLLTLLIGVIVSYISTHGAGSSILAGVGDAVINVYLTIPTCPPGWTCA